MDASDFPDEKPEPGKETIYLNSWYNVRFRVADRLVGQLNSRQVYVILGWHSPPLLDAAHRRYLERFVFARKQSDGRYIGWYSYADEGFCVSKDVATDYAFEREWQVARDRYPCCEISRH